MEERWGTNIVVAVAPNDTRILHIADPLGYVHIVVTRGEAWVHGSRVSVGELVEVSISKLGISSMTIEVGPGGALLWIRCLERCFRLLQSEPKQGESTLIPRSWRDALSSVVITTTVPRYNRMPPVICVCGGKGAGKDIYARLIVNTILFSAGEVAIIDGDPANPLFGYPGLVKLGLLHETVTAPSPTNFNIDGLRRRRVEALETLFLGSFPKDNPALYVANVARLLHRWRALGDSRPPVVINCSGYSNRISGDLAAKIFKACDGDYLVRLTSNPRYAAANFPRNAGVEVTKPQHETSRGSFEWLPWAYDCIAAHAQIGNQELCKRLYQRQTLFLDSFTASHPGRRFGMRVREFMTDCFAHLTPWCIPMSNMRVYRGDGNLLIPLTNIECLVGCIVGLVTRHTDVVTEYISFALVRSIDVEAGVLYVLSPEREVKLKEMNMLVTWDARSPSTYYNAGPSSILSNLPYVSSNCLAAEGTGAGVIRSRKNILRGSSAGKRKGSSHQ